MCKVTAKPLFASGFGVSLLTHFCSVGNRLLNVVNGNQKGGDMTELSRYSSENMGPDDVYLDNRTGDFFQYSQGNW